MSDPETPLTAVCCGIFRRELAQLDPQVLGGARTVFFDSMLHMQPAKLDARLTRLLAQHPEERHLLVYGDCSPHMRELAARPRVSRVQGVNCCEIMLGPERYRELRQAGFFFLLPEWTMRWEEVFKQQLGFTDQSLARAFMHEMHKGLLYLDTGLTPVPETTLAAVEAHFEMPVEVRQIDLAHLQTALAEGLDRLRHV